MEKRDLADEVGAKVRRKVQARCRSTPGAWLGLGAMGLIGWSIVLPTLLGAALGLWLDKRYPGARSWTLALLIGGLVLGCFNAWRWLSREQKMIQRDHGEPDE
jgi:ATP synthase protein I